VRIIQLQAENIKKLRAVSITPEGNVVQITGPNGAGKTSVLDAIFFALGGTSDIASQPIRRGEDEASVRVDLGEYVVRREFSASGTRLYVESQDGARFPSPQKLLDGLLGKLTFDPLAFTRMGRKEQLETLRSLVRLDVDVDKLDRENTRDYDNRREINRRATSFRERVTTLRAGVDRTVDVTPIDISALTADMEKASAHNAAIDRERDRRTARARRAGELLGSAGTYRDRAQQLRDEAADADAEANRLVQEAHALQSEVDEPLPDPIDVAGIRESITVAVRANQHKDQQRRNREQLQEATKLLDDTLNQSEVLTKAIDDRTKAKADAIARAAMPVPGLGFGDGEVTYNGLPFEQASSAEQLRVSFAMAMAANPKLKVVLIRDGSLLDEKSLALVAEMAEAHDFQVWLEKAEIGGRVGILMEDGAIAAIDGAPVTQDAAAD
jgi:DNA repair exonuclease SbcCD ATPase subunit